MRKKLIIQLWLRQLLQYLLIPAVLCAILLPIYEIFWQQTVKAQLADASEQLGASVNSFENCIYNIRYITNKFFHDSTCTLIAISQDSEPLVDNLTANNASNFLNALTYGLSPVSYSYVTFSQNSFVVDSNRFYFSHSSFYPNALEYSEMDCQQWLSALGSIQTTCIPTQKIRLYRTAYPEDYLTVSQPFFDSSERYMGTCSFLLREKQLIQMFLPYDEWEENCIFYITKSDGSLLLQHNFDQIAALEDISAGVPYVYQEQKYLFVSRQISSFDATAVIGLPYTVYAENLSAVNRVIFTYIGFGLLGCIVLSTIMTSIGLRRVKPFLDAVDSEDTGTTRILEDVLQKLQNHDWLAQKLEHTQNQLEYGRMEALLKVGFLGTDDERLQLRQSLHLSNWNYLLLVPTPEDTDIAPDVRLVLTAKQIASCYSCPSYTHNTSDGNIVAILSVAEDTQEVHSQLYQQTRRLHEQLNLDRPLVLSSKFSKLEHISSAYWMVRNAAARADSGQSVCFVALAAQTQPSVPGVTVLELLNEYLLAGLTENAQATVRQLFGSEDLSLSTFQQIFFSVRGVLLSTAEKVGCEDISYLSSFNSRQPMLQQVDRLCECCLNICAHVDLVKQSHNQQRQKNIMKYLEDHFADPDLNAAMVAEQFKISKKYVSQFLKDQTGKSFSEYVEDLRLSNAVALLHDSDLSITDIAIACGFTSQNTFYKSFRRRYGISPSALRQEKTKNG